VGVSAHSGVCAMFDSGSAYRGHWVDAEFRVLLRSELKGGDYTLWRRSEGEKAIDVAFPGP